MKDRNVRGFAMLSRGPGGRTLLVGAAGSDASAMAQSCAEEIRRQGGSLDPEDWMGWTLDRAPTPDLLREIEARVARGDGGGSHPAAITLVVDPDHPKLRARGDA